MCRFVARTSTLKWRSARAAPPSVSSKTPRTKCSGSIFWWERASECWHERRSALCMDGLYPWGASSGTEPTWAMWARSERRAKPALLNVPDTTENDIQARPKADARWQRAGYENAWTRGWPKAEPSALSWKIVSALTYARTPSNDQTHRPPGTDWWKSNPKAKHSHKWWFGAVP